MERLRSGTFDPCAALSSRDEQLVHSHGLKRCNQAYGSNFILCKCPYDAPGFQEIEVCIFLKEWNCPGTIVS